MGLYNLKQGSAQLADMMDGRMAYGMGVGNVYWVCKSTETFYQDFLEDHQGTYTDGSAKVYTTIQIVTTT